MHHRHHSLVFGCDDCIAAVRPPSTDRDRTRIRNALLDQGMHPATHRPLANNGETCGSCSFFLNWGRYFKCSNPSSRGVSHGPATDIRKSWPACELWRVAS